MLISTGTGKDIPITNLPGRIIQITGFKEE
jgi:hypothetical protein